MTELLMVVLGVAQPGLMLLLAALCLRFLWDLDHSMRERRAANPSVRHGVLFLAVAGLGRGALLVRTMLFEVGSPDIRAWLLVGNPDLVGAMTGVGVGLCGVTGAMLLLRGCRALIFRDASGEVVMPRAGRMAMVAAVLAALAMAVR